MGFDIRGFQPDLPARKRAECTSIRLSMPCAVRFVHEASNGVFSQGDFIAYPLRVFGTRMRRILLTRICADFQRYRVSPQITQILTDFQGRCCDKHGFTRVFIHVFWAHAKDSKAKNAKGAKPWRMFTQLCDLPFFLCARCVEQQAPELHAYICMYIRAPAALPRR